MSTSLYVKSTLPQIAKFGQRRSVADLLEPLEIIASNSASLIANHGARFDVNGEPYELPRYLSSWLFNDISIASATLDFDQLIAENVAKPRNTMAEDRWPSSVSKPD